MESKHTISYFIDNEDNMIYLDQWFFDMIKFKYTNREYFYFNEKLYIVKYDTELNIIDVIVNNATEYENTVFKLADLYKTVKIINTEIKGKKVYDGVSYIDEFEVYNDIIIAKQAGFDPDKMDNIEVKYILNKYTTKEENEYYKKYLNEMKEYAQDAYDRWCNGDI